MPTLTLNQETHEYAVDGAPVHGVSKILHAAGLIDSTWLSEEALKRGSFVHQSIEYYLQGDLDEASLDPKLGGFLAAFKKAERELGLVVDRAPAGSPIVEHKIFHPILRYAGTVDLVVRKGGAGHRIVIDLKTGSPDFWHPYQLAAYAMAFTEDLVLRANLYLQPNGDYRWIERTDRRDFEIWKGALAIGGLRIEKGLAK